MSDDALTKSHAVFGSGCGNHPGSGVQHSNYCIWAAELIRNEQRERDDARRRLAEATKLLAEEFEVSLCMEAPPGSQVTDCFCIDLTDPNGKPTCLPCRARAFLGPSTPTAEPPRCKHGITGPCRRCATTGRDEP